MNHPGKCVARHAGKRARQHAIPNTSSAQVALPHAISRRFAVWVAHVMSQLCTWFMLDMPVWLSLFAGRSLVSEHRCPNDGNVAAASAAVGQRSYNLQHGDNIHPCRRCIHSPGHPCQHGDVRLSCRALTASWNVASFPGTSDLSECGAKLQARRKLRQNHDLPKRKARGQQPTSRLSTEQLDSVTRTLFEQLEQACQAGSHLHMHRASWQTPVHP